MNKEENNRRKEDIGKDLFVEIKQLIEEGRQSIAQAVNVGLTATYWNVGKKINEDILKNKRADYGKQVVSTLSQQLTEEYGNGFSTKNIRRMLQFNELFPDYTIVASLMRQLSWTHFTILIPLKSDLKRDFYTQLLQKNK